MQEVFRLNLKSDKEFYTHELYYGAHITFDVNKKIHI